MKLAMTPFCLNRQFGPDNANGLDYISALRLVDQIEQEIQIGGALITDGYAPFCRHVWPRNYLGLPVGVSLIAFFGDAVRSGYEARNEKELPVLTRWIELPNHMRGHPPATHLDVILYSAEQCAKENDPLPEGVDYGIVAIIPTATPGVEYPIPPITMMRNALGIEYGGSGVPVDEKAYRASVEFWEKHAIIKYVKE